MIRGPARRTAGRQRSEIRPARNALACEAGEGQSLPAVSLAGLEQEARSREQPVTSNNYGASTPAADLRNVDGITDALLQNKRVMSNDKDLDEQ